MKIFGGIKDCCGKINNNIKNIFLYDCNEYIERRRENIEKNQTNAFFENDESVQSEKMLFAIFFLFLFSVLAVYYMYVDLKDNITRNDISFKTEPLTIDISNPLDEVQNILTFDYKIKSGDTLLNILTRKLNIENGTAFTVIKELNKLYSLNNLAVGQVLNIKYKTEISTLPNNNISYKNILEELKIKKDNEDSVVIYKTDDNTYAGKIVSQQFIKQYERYRVKIKNSIYVDGVDAGIPPAIVISLMNYFSFDIDFVRDIREGDEFEVFFESYFSEKGKREKHGDIIFAKIKLRGTEYNIYRYNTKKYGVMYFNEFGVSNNKTLLKTPINGARLSSNFSLKRKHPILGYTRAHKGVDFAAPLGTPFFAGGSGTIVAMKKGYNGGYGNYMRIKHNESYSTVYAHLSKFAKDAYVGKKVKQGDVIAYVGNTGMSTGPHLHYEILYKGKQINPRSIKSIANIKLSGNDLINFNDYREKIDIYRKNTLTNL